MVHTESTDLHRIFVSRKGRGGGGAYSVSFVYFVCNNYVLLSHKSSARLRPLAYFARTFASESLVSSKQKEVQAYARTSFPLCGGRIIPK